ncbi:MAG: DUF4115 domain-containing protein [Rhodospirillales bacterium]|nr:DUF4115 domain-containing protein [Rhodospirillales bacterium]
MQQNTDQTQQSQQWDYYNADIPVGYILRRTREHYGQTLADVEAILRIRACQLEAIEEGRSEDLPGRVYAIGFVRAYAEYLGLPPDDIVHLFKIQVAGAGGHRPSLQMPVAASESKIPGRYILAASLTALVAIIAGLLMTAGNHEIQPAAGIPPVPQTMKEKSADLSLMDNMPLEGALYAAIETAAGDPAWLEPGTDVSSAMIIEATDKAWVEIRAKDDTVLLSRILEKGESFSVPVAEGLVLDTGNMGALSFTIGGRALPVEAADGEIRRGVELDKLLPASTEPAAGDAYE